MQKTIERFIREYDNGLYLIDIPTGVGKTYQTIEYIYNHIDKDYKFFYITSLTKNVNSAYEQLQSFFNRNNRNDFESKCLRIYSNAEVLMERLVEIKIARDDIILKWDSFKLLKKQVEAYQNIYHSTSFPQKLEIIEKFSTDIKEIYEPAFRKDLENYLKDKGKNKKSRFNFINSNHKWLLDIYPSILTDYRKVYFLTIDKFYLGNSTIIESSYKFINKQELMKKAIVFIDEIDATKNTILNRQIEESLKNNINIFSLFLSIRSSLNYKKFPKEMLRPCENNKEKGKQQEEILIKMKRVFDNAFKENSMQYAFKSREKDLFRKYIFEDDEHITIAKEDEQNEIFVIKNSNENYNYLSFKQNKEDNAERLYSIMSSIQGAITYFLNGVYFLAVNYYQYYNENKQEFEDKMQLDDAVQSIAKAFNLDQIYITYIQNIINSKMSTLSAYDISFSTSIYDYGFRYYLFEDAINNNLNTNIKMYNLWSTPEFFLLKLAKCAHVIGLSATSTLLTVTGNYDIDFIERHLGQNYFYPTNTEKIRIGEFIDDKLKTNKSNINVHIVNVEDINKSINELFTSEDYRQLINSIITSSTNGSTEEFLIRRFLKVADVIKQFCVNENGKSILILTNRNLIDKGYDLYSLSNFNKILEFIINENKLTNNYKIVNLVSKNFEEKKKEYQDLINKKQKVIIFSSYPTTGAGQNLQYEYIENDDIITEDIDSIYMENPTNLLVNINHLSESSDKDLIKYIFQIESLCSSGEVSIKDKYNLVKEGFHRMLNSNQKFNHQNPYETNSVRNHGLRILIQAVGRLCRVRNKVKDTNIYLDYETICKIDFSVVKNKKLNKEFYSIIERVKSYIEKQENRKQYLLCIKKAENDSKKMFNIIRNYVIRSEWTDKNMKAWTELREQVLKYPTAFNENLGDFGKFESCYLKSNDFVISYYRYKKLDDFGTVNISLKNEYGYSIVSEDDCLAKLMKVPFLKEAFIKYGYATTFKENTYIMLPIIFNNIYKGALGEVCGKIIFKKYLNIELDEITDGQIFEKFDFIKGNNFFDFKFWNDTPYVNVDIDKFIEKAKKVNAKKSFVINILGNNDEKVKERDNLIIIPSLIDNKTLKINNDALAKIYNYMEK